MTVTTTAPIPTPTWGTIPAGEAVEIRERIPGFFLISQGRRTSALLTAAQVAEVTA
jgi:hypothetical protein